MARAAPAPLLVLASALMGCALPGAFAQPPPARRDAGRGAPDAAADAAASQRAARCEVRAEALLAASRWRGPGPMTPATAEMLRRDPQFARAYNGISHGDQHLRCTYRVRVNGRRYRYAHTVGNTFGALDESHCRTVGAAVEARVREFTRGCTDLRAGEYYGYRLEPYTAGAGAR